MPPVCVEKTCRRCKRTLPRDRFGNKIGPDGRHQGPYPYCRECASLNQATTRGEAEIRAKMTPPNPSGRCMCGCGEPVIRATKSRPSRGWVHGEYIRFVPGHQRRLSPHEYLPEDRGYTTPCWIWQRGADQYGYGRIYQGSGMVAAHRAIYERLVGPIPSGYELHHQCETPSCVNPDHLRPLPRREHMKLDGRLHRPRVKST